MSKTTLSHAEMEALVSTNQGVIYEGRIITNIHALPSEAELAEGDAVAEADVAAKLKLQIEQFQAQLDKLNAPKPEPDDKPEPVEEVVP